MEGSAPSKALVLPPWLLIFSFLGTLLTHAAAVHGVDVNAEEVRLARTALVRLGLVGRSSERDRRPTPQELNSLIDYFEVKPRQVIPVSRIIRFAVATAMRLEEICSFTWEDVDLHNRMVTVKNRKDPRKKDGNNQRVPLLDFTGYSAWEIILELHVVTHGKGRVFPHHHKSTGTAFHRACQELGISDLHFHDLRHEATSRLFEAGLTIERVALVTGHKDWKMLRRYTNLRPKSLHKARPNEKGQEIGLVPAILKTAWLIASSVLAGIPTGILTYFLQMRNRWHFWSHATCRSSPRHAKVPRCMCPFFNLLLEIGDKWIFDHGILHDPYCFRPTATFRASSFFGSWRCRNRVDGLLATDI